MVKYSWRSEDLDVMLRSSTRLHSSPKKFRVRDIAKLRNSEIVCIARYIQHEGFRESDCERQSCEDERSCQRFGRIITKQDVILAWEADVGSTTEGTSHRFNNIVVRSYQDVKYISLPKDGVNMVEIEDIGDVAEDNLSEYSITVHSAEVISVLTLESYAACLVCKAKVGPTTGKPGLLHQV